MPSVRELLIFGRFQLRSSQVPIIRCLSRSKYYGCGYVISDFRESVLGIKVTNIGAKDCTRKGWFCDREKTSKTSGSKVDYLLSELEY